MRTSGDDENEPSEIPQAALAVLAHSPVLDVDLPPDFVKLVEHGRRQREIIEQLAAVVHYF